VHDSLDSALSESTINGSKVPIYDTHIDARRVHNRQRRSARGRALNGYFSTIHERLAIFGDPVGSTSGSNPILESLCIGRHKRRSEGFI
jgi:hypothetical protein